jgi:thioesterase domain-containing protein/acyl carrier protein
VEPMEVELALRQAAAPYAGITDMAVIARSSSDGSSAGTQLVAFLVGDADEHVEGAIFASLRDVLPDYMIPPRTEWLTALPRTASGKRADRELAALPLRAITVDHVPPRDEHEAVIAQLVADVLGVSHVGVFDEFSSMGGDSLSAVRLIVAIEQRYGLSIPVSSLLTGPTVAVLAERVRDRVAVEFDPCVPIKPTGSRPPLFLVHPIGGTVLCYVELSKHLPPEQPLYGLQAAGIEPGTTASQSISEMAHSYVDAIRRVQPHGPYHIGGWSLGGVIAFEMARQLEAQGHDAGSVLLLDSAALGGGVAAELPGELLYESFMWELLSAKRGADAPVEHLPDGFDSAEEVLDYILGRAVEHRVLPAGSKEMVRRLFEVFRGGMLAVERYRPQACDCAVTLLRAADPLPEVVRPAHDHVGSLYGESTNGWDRYVTGDLTLIEAPGNHLTMVEKPYAAALATLLGDLLAESKLKTAVG